MNRRIASFVSRIFATPERPRQSPSTGIGPRGSLLLLFPALLLAPAAGAATLNVVGGELLGASDVNVGGTLYDVTFVRGRCILIAAFNGCDEASDFQFSTSADGGLASSALLDQVFLDGGGNLFDTDPELTEGCSSTTTCFMFTPWGLSISGVSVSTAQNSSTETSDAVFANGGAHSSGLIRTFAVWTVVPEPATGVLLAAGVVGLAVRRRRQHPSS